MSVIHAIVRGRGRVIAAASVTGVVIFFRTVAPSSSASPTTISVPGSTTGSRATVVALVVVPVVVVSVSREGQMCGLEGCGWDLNAYVFVTHLDLLRRPLWLFCLF